MAYDWTLLTLASPFSSLEIAPPFFIAHLFGESGFMARYNGNRRVKRSVDSYGMSNLLSY